VMQYANELPITELTLKLYPGDEPSSFTMFEDDGISWDYQSGGYALTTYTMSVQNGALTLDISDRDGNYLPDSRIYTAEVHRWATSPQCVAVDGVPLASYATLSGLMAADSGYYYDSGAGILYCRFADSGDHMVLTAGPDAISPAIGGFYSAGVSASGEITVRAMCSDSESGMDRVEFFVGGAWQQTITGDHPSGYDFNWTPPGADAYTLSVTAYDQAGNSSSAQLPLSCVSSIGDARSLPDGSQVCVLDGKPVTAVFASGDPAMSGRYVYVEEPLRFSGIRVRTDNASVAKGDAVWVVGVVDTVTFGSKSQAEKYIDCTASSGSIAVDGTASVPGALALSGRSIETINRGLLVTIWGTVTAAGSCGGYPYIYIDDGSPTAAAHDLLAPAGSTETFDGMRVYGTAPAGLEIGDFVLVTGVASCELPVNFDELNPVVRVNSESDIRVLPTSGI